MKRPRRLLRRNHRRKATIPFRAVAYYRTTTIDKRSISRQRKSVRQWARQHGATIVREFIDEGESGRGGERCPAFEELLHWIRHRHDFQFVLCLDRTRWSRDRPCHPHCLFDKHVIFLG